MKTRIRTRPRRVQRKREHTHTSSNMGAYGRSQRHTHTRSWRKQSSQIESSQRERVAQFNMVPFPGCSRDAPWRGEACSSFVSTSLYIYNIFASIIIFTHFLFCFASLYCLLFSQRISLKSYVFTVCKCCV